MANQNAMLPILSRASPVLLVIIALLNCIVNPCYNAFYLFIMLIALFPINWIIKHWIFKPIYTFFKTETLPILGIGKRPPECAMNCNCNYILDNIVLSQFGMPSGHSQIIWTVGIYIICKIFDKWKNKNNDEINLEYLEYLYYLNYLDYIWLIIVCFIILSMVYVSYSRVYIEECHTLQQVIVGSVLGIISGFIIYYFENYISILFI
jgi:membrane-associated phospholipid phosphatase